MKKKTKKKKKKLMKLDTSKVKVHGLGVKSHSFVLSLLANSS